VTAEVQQWIEDQLAKAPPMDDATARRVSLILFGGDK